MSSLLSSEFEMYKSKLKQERDPVDKILWLQIEHALKV